MQNNKDEQKKQLEELLAIVESNKVMEEYLKNYKDEDYQKGAKELLFDDESKEFFYEKLFKRDSEGGVEYIDYDMISRQRGILPHLLKSLGAAIIQGKPISIISTPLEFNESRTTLERMASTLAYAPTLLQKGAEVDDPFEQLCITLAQWVASFHLASYQQNPLEATSGETFQGILGGCPVYFEQLTPVSGSNVEAFQLLGKDFTLQGKWPLSMTLYPHKATGQLLGSSQAVFKNNGTVVEFYHPPCIITGLAIGKRKIDYGGKFYIWDEKNQYFGELNCDPPADGFWSKKTTLTDFISGRIVRAKPAVFKKIRESLKKNNTIDIKLKEGDDFKEEVAKVEGSWLDSLKINDKVYWKFGSIKPHKLIHVQNVLPSDSNLRKDVIFHKLGKYDDATKAREEIMIRETEDVKKKKKDQKSFFSSFF